MRNDVITDCPHFGFCGSSIYNGKCSKGCIEMYNAINRTISNPGKKGEMKMEEDRKDCPMRHSNGNCLPCGGFCTAVNNEICYFLHNAYQSGYADARTDAIEKFDLVSPGVRRAPDD